MEGIRVAWPDSVGKTLPPLSGLKLGEWAGVRPIPMECPELGGG